MMKRIFSYFYILVLAVGITAAFSFTAAAASLPDKLFVAPSEINSIPDKIEAFNSSGTSYDLYLPGNASEEDCFFSWDGELEATVEGSTYPSGECPVPASGQSMTYTFRLGTQTKTFSVKTHKGSAAVKPIFIDIDESQGTIAAMDEDQSHEASCTGRINIEGSWIVMTKIKGRGNYTWKMSQDKKAYNITLDSKININGIDAPKKTKKWSIVSEVGDHSLLCNRSGFKLAHAMDIGQDTASADVWMNGEYQGCYTLTPKYDSFVTNDGFLIEEDNYLETLSIADGGDPQFSLEGLNTISRPNPNNSDYNLITVKKIGDNLLMKDGVVDESPENIQAVTDTIHAWLQDMWDAIRSDDGYNSKGRYYTEYIDIESFAKMYLMHEYVKSYDVCAGSILFHRDGATDDDKLIAGPLWDLDNSMGSVQSNTSLGSVGDRRSGKGAFLPQITEYKTSIFKTLYTKHVDFQHEVYRQYNRNHEKFQALESQTQDLIDEISDSAKMNHNKVIDITGYNLHKYSRATTLENGDPDYAQSMKATTNSKTDWQNYADNLKTYIHARSLWFNNNYLIDDFGVITAGFGTDEGGKYTITTEGSESEPYSDKTTYTLNDGTAATVRAMNDPGYRFAGWYKGQAGADGSAEGHTDDLISQDKEYTFIPDHWEGVCLYAVFETCPHEQLEEKAEEQYLKTPADCTNPEVYYKSCTVCGMAGTDTFEHGEPLGHDYAVSYDFAEDGSSCTATAVCSRDDSHVVTEEAEITSAVKVPAKCEEKGTTTYTAAFTNELFEAQTKDVEDIPALGHDWEVSYDFAEDGSSCTATAVCSRDDTHVLTEEAKITSAVKVPAKCEEKGTTTYTAAFTKEPFETQTKDVVDIPALGHDYEVSYDFVEDGSACTATAVCKHDDTHVVTEEAKITSAVKVPAKCEEKGTTTYTASFESELFETQTKDVVDIPALGHDFVVSYDFAEYGSSCTATAVCRRDETHVVTEEAEITSAVKVPAKCEEKGTTTYTASFESELFEKQTKDVIDIPALGHDWDTVVYLWAEDNSKVTASRVCRRDSSHFEIETVDTVSEVTKSPACEEKGETTYTAVFENEAFPVQTKTEADIPAFGHDYVVSYDFAEDGSSCTATAICKHDDSHVVTEDAKITSAVKVPAKCEEKGTTTYTAAFENELFETQTKDVADIPALGHDYTVSYDFAEDGSSCTATATCKRDDTHVVTEEAEITSAVKVPVKCEEKGTTTYTAAFENELFKEQTIDVEDIPALGHDYKVSYEWAEDGSSCAGTAVCKHDDSHVVTENAKITSAVKVPAKCEEKGTTTYTAAFENKLFGEQTKDVVDIPALGHDYVVSYKWAEDGSTCTATATCSRDDSHVVSEEAEITSAVKVPAKCEEKGTTTYTAVFENELFEAQTKDIEDIPVLGHDYKVSYDFAEDGSSCTASAVCSRDDTHVVTEEAEITSAVKVPAKCEEKGTTTYTAAFKNELFEAQTRDIEDIPALGHDYEVSYDFAEDGSSCTAKAVCKHDDSHIVTEEAEITSAVKVPAKCEEKGTTTYTAAFSNEMFEAQTKDVEDIPALGHDWSSWQSVDDDIHERACSRDGSHVEKAPHEYDEGIVTKEATLEEEGVITYRCHICDHEKQEVIPKIQPDPEDQMGTDGTALGPGASYAAANKAITGMKNDNDPAGSKFSPLILLSTRQTTKSVKLTWKVPKKAVRFVIYGNRCGKANRMKRIKVISSSKKAVTFKKVAGKKVKKGTHYKFILLALDKDNNVVSSSKVLHVVTKGSKYGNYKSVKTRAKKNRVTLKAGKSFNLKAKAISPSKKLKMSVHVKMRYESSNLKVAGVTKKGVIKARSKGTCYVYAFAQDDVYKKIRVTVR